MKRLLIVSAFFPPSMEIGAQRPYRLARNIERHGWQPFVLTTGERCGGPADAGFTEHDLTGIQVERVACRSLWNHSLWWRYTPPGFRWWLAAAQQTVARLTIPFLPVDALYPWALAAAARGRSIVQRHKIDLIWSTGPPLSVHRLSRDIAMRTNTPYVADFRDVRFFHRAAPLSLRDRSWARLEQKVLHAAAGITYVSAPAADVLESRFPSLAGKRHELIHNWFDREEIDSCKAARFDKPTIMSGGRLYGSARRVDRFFAAVVRLKEQDRSGAAGNLRFVHYGGNPNVHRDIFQLSEPMGLGEIVRCEPAAPRAEFLAACKGADILLLLVGHDGDDSFMHQGSIPGKLYNYLAAGRPILVVGPRGCEAGKIVERVRRGIAVPDDEPESIADAIERLLGRRQPAVPLDLSPEAVREFETAAAVKKMADFLDSVVSRGDNK